MSNTKEQLLHEASRMLLSKGYHGFSLQELADKLSIKKASLFYHFPSKEALGIELVKFYQQSFLLWAEKHKKLSSEKQIIAYGLELNRWICLKKRVCPVGSMSVEWGIIGKSLQDEVIKLHESQKNWLTGLFKSINKEDPLKTTVSEAVDLFMTLIHGSLQLARIVDRDDLVKKNLKTFFKAVKA
jgi:TetR/AcrR family transcriptional repressor of nem operon